MPTTRRTLWPYAIIATFVLFAGFIGYMVQRAFHTDVELVSPDYYKQEIAYQKRMESVARTAALPAPVPLARIKAEPELAGMDLLRQSRLSVSPVSEAHWRRILALGGLPDGLPGEAA